MVIVQFWLKQLSNCAFEKAGFKNIFNPAMIDLLFDNDGKTSLQFHIQAAVIGTNNDKFENCLKFCLNHCAVYKTLMLFFMQNDDVDILEQYTDVLFNIIINEGNKFPRVTFGIFKLTRLYDHVVEVRVIWYFSVISTDFLRTLFLRTFFADTFFADNRTE